MNLYDAHHFPYTLVTWVGISGELFYPFNGAGGPDSSLVTNEWLSTNIRNVSSFGSTYPEFAFIMEGDTPTFLSLIQNGLNVVGKPRWGGWGGRYARISRFDNLYVNAFDSNVSSFGSTYPEFAYLMEGDMPTFLNLIQDGLNVVGKPRWGGWGGRYARISRFDNLYVNAFDSNVIGQNGANFTSTQTTIWPVNHNPVVVVNRSSAVADPLHLTDAGATHDPDSDALARVSFWQYGDVSQFQQSPLATPVLDIVQTGLHAVVTVPPLTEFTGTGDWAAWTTGRGANENDTSLHVIVEVWDDGTPNRHYKI
ncbi:hypothetical protein B0H17DRAFT_1203970 [Mycena rosella]|uniref:Uncharacterized protein n=1 Tax=Mycena rosella TaxID=1033263 RepID=A0AAD7DC54_MYCRO|nr:hypothetical protein B0H17DRAFT_1203970 [Mycena rosella]